MHSYKKWVPRALALNLAAMALMALFNLVIDPYGMYRLVSLPGLTDNKHMENSQPRMSKTFVIKRLRPKAFAFGTSRTEIGIDPAHPGWDEQLAPIFNFGLGGVPIADIADRFAWTSELTGFSQAVLGLDFFMFNAYRSNPFDQTRKSIEETPFRAALEPYTASLLTLDALQASITTLRKRDPVKYPRFLANGQVAWSFREGRVSKYGYNKAFQRAENSFFEDVMFPSPAKKYAFVNPRTGQESFDCFRKILELSRHNNIDLKLFISPVHARMYEVYAEAGLWPLFEDWKRQLVAILAADAADHPDSPAFVLWDFTGFSSITTEEVPVPGDVQTRMTWYWESSHFKKETGDFVLDRIFAYEHPLRQPPEDFGIIIDEDNLEAHLKSIRQGQQQYRLNHQRDVAEVAATGRASTWRDN